MARNKIITAYGDLVKLRLTLSVVFSAGFGYIYASQIYDHIFNYLNFSTFITGMFLIIASSNIYNQILERKTDGLMDRTCKRPLVTKYIPLKKAIIIMILSLLLSLYLIYRSSSVLVACLAFCSWVLYVWAYTPLKKIHPIAVWVGTVPGALPPLLGYLTISEQMTFFAFLIFLVQVLWQLPHFWAIAWVNYKDYSKANFYLLPRRKKDKFTAGLIFLAILSLFLFTFLAGYYDMINLFGVVSITILNLFFIILGIQFFRTLEGKLARQVMFFSFVYLPIFQVMMIVFY